MEKTGYIYILANPHNTVLYTGVTSNLTKRISEHKNKHSNFSKKYNCTKLVYFEHCGDIARAIYREKQIKGGSRQKKIGLINKLNPEWRDLSDQVYGC